MTKDEVQKLYDAVPEDADLTHILEPYRQFAVPVDAIQRDPANANTHPDRNIEQIAQSLDEFGQRAPLVVRRKTQTITTGNGRHLVAQEHLEWDYIACVFPDDSSLDATRFAIMDNASGRSSEWDHERLAEELQSIIDDQGTLQGTGFNDTEMEELLNELEQKNTQGDMFGAPEPGEPDEAQKTWGVEEGQLWQIGPHRLLCGDCRDPELVARLFGDRKADQLVTDPPYGVDYSSKNDFLNEYDKGNHIKEAIENDAIDDYVAFFYQALAPAPMAEKNTVYCFIEKEEDALSAAFEKADIYLSQRLIWVKNNHVLGRQDYDHKHETIFYGWRGTHKFWATSHRTTVLEYSRPVKSDLHPTMKPIPLLRQLLQDGSSPSGLIYDPFSGSGSTMVAAQETGRSCYGFELVPKYASVILQRLSEMGLEPEVLDE